MDTKDEKILSEEGEFEKKDPKKEEDKPIDVIKKEDGNDGEEDDMKKKKPSDENACGGGGSGSSTKKKKYDLADVVEYQELNSQYTELQKNYEALQAEKDALTAELADLKQYKLESERKNKQDMIDSFYMLEEADKQDVVEHIDTYSLDEIEGKLAVICVRKKVNFDLEQDQKEQDIIPTLFNLNGAEDNAPDWIKAVRATAKN